MIGTVVKKIGWLGMGAFSLVAVPSVAQAHFGGGAVHDLLHGIEHPLVGLDHILAMLAVGIFAAQRGGRATWLIPTSFVLVMTIGCAMGVAGLALPYVEHGIVLSLVVLGVLIAAAARLPLVASMALVGVFALLHGHAHGTELPATAVAVSYTLGFILATAGLHAAGIVFALSMRRFQASQLLRAAGGAIAVCGIYLGLQ